MRIRVLLAALSVIGLVGAAAPASAATKACYDVQVNVNGQAVVSEADCVEA